MKQWTLLREYKLQKTDLGLWGIHEIYLPEIDLQRKNWLSDLIVHMYYNLKLLIY